MKIVILAGGLGTRISEESHLKPKPMIEIGDKPIIWHIMKIYSHYGFNDFVICLGYKGYIIKEYFANYFLHSSNVTIDLAGNGMEVHNSEAEPWRITLVDTGLNTSTGGRLKRVRQYLDDQTFMMTYGDGVGDIPIDVLVDFHRKHGKLATITSVQPPGRFGAINIDESGMVFRFFEKPQGDGAWVNGGFFVLEPEVIDYIEGDDTIWEHQPMTRLSSEAELVAYKHHGYWWPMDTMRDKAELEERWNNATAPWKIWT